MIEISIENMTEVSCLLFVMSGVSAASAVILFFALDIAKCWRMVSRRYPAYKKIQRSAKAASWKKVAAEKTDRCPTQRLNGFQETVLLEYNGQEDTELLDGNTMEMIQDIVYIHDTTEIG